MYNVITGRIVINVRSEVRMPYHYFLFYNILEIFDAIS